MFGAFNAGNSVLEASINQLSPQQQAQIGYGYAAMAQYIIANYPGNEIGELSNLSSAIEWLGKAEEGSKSPFLIASLQSMQTALSDLLNIT